jgi:hypothetical protein
MHSSDRDIRGLPDEVHDYLDDEEIPAAERVGERLSRERPAPPVLLRSALRRRILEMMRTGAHHTARRPPRFRLQVAGYLASGVVSLVIAALGLAGAGPLAY